MGSVLGTWVGFRVEAFELGEQLEREWEILSSMLHEVITDQRRLVETASAVQTCNLSAVLLFVHLILFRSVTFIPTRVYLFRHVIYNQLHIP